MGVLIRAIRRKDTGACLAIYNPYITGSCITFEEVALTDEQFAQRVRDITQHYPFLVAEEDGRILGYAYLSAFHTRSAYRYTADLSIYLDRDCRRQGIGSRLYDAIEQQARAAGIRTIVSLITETNTDSLRFHERHGFRLVGCLEQVGYKFDRWLSVKYYQKIL